MSESRGVGSNGDELQISPPLELRRQIQTVIAQQELKMSQIEKIFFSYLPRSCKAVIEFDTVMRANYGFIEVISQESSSPDRYKEVMEYLFAFCNKVFDESQAKSFFADLLKLDIFRAEVREDFRQHLIDLEATKWVSQTSAWIKSTSRGWCTDDIIRFSNAAGRAVAESILFHDRDLNWIQHAVDQIARTQGWYGHQFIAEQYTQSVRVAWDDMSLASSSCSLGKK